MSKSKARLLFLVTEDWYFCLHRLSLARAARDNGYEVLVATRLHEHGNQIAAEGFKVIPLKLVRSSLNPVAELMAVAELVRIYRREKPDIVHHVGLKPILYGSWAARLAHIGGVVNAFAGLGYVYTGTRWSHRILRAIMRPLLRGIFANPATIALFQNADDRETLRSQRIVTTQRAVVIRGSGVDEKTFSPTTEPLGDPVVLLAARMLWDKGIGEFINAARTIRLRGIRAQFVLSGRRDPCNPSSIAEDQLREWQNAGLVEWWGQQDAMPGVLAQSHIVVLPSYREGLPKSLLEAAACARPIVATDVPGCREVVRNGENGFLVPVRDSGALAEALITLIQNPDLRRRMGERGRDLVVREFTVAHVTARTIQLYDKIACAAADSGGGLVHATANDMTAGF